MDLITLCIVILLIVANWILSIAIRNKKEQINLLMEENIDLTFKVLILKFELLKQYSLMRTKNEPGKE